MWSAICNYVYDKFLSKLSTGQKRRNEEWADYPPIKQMKFDNTSQFDAEETYDFTKDMKKDDNIFDNGENCAPQEVIAKKWASSSGTMARQPIHSSKYDLGSGVVMDGDKSKLKSNTNDESLKEPLESSGTGETEVVKYVTRNPTQHSQKLLKNKLSQNRSFSSHRASKIKQSGDKSKPASFQSRIKTSLNCLKETYRLSEKVQYMQLLQQQTKKLNSVMKPHVAAKENAHIENRLPIPVIDLTTEKTNAVVNRSRENIPRTSSQTKSNDDLAMLSAISDMKEVPKSNSLQNILKTHPVTECEAIEEILFHHSSETAEKLRLAEIEKAKLEVLSENNRKAYCDALEEKIRVYMRITTPVLEEVQTEEEKYVLPELTKEQESKISSLFVPSPAGEIIVDKFGLQIKRRDLQTLKGLNWLNDEIINFYMNLIMDRGKKTNKPSVYAFNTFFYPKLLSGGHASLKRWTKKVDIFSHDIVFVPVHLGMHWCMAVIDFRSKEVRYYDSMGSANNRCLQALLSYLEAESLDKKKKPYSTSDWEQINVEDIPQQMNGSDCGVFSCTFAEHIARDSPLLFCQEHMPYFRKKMAIEIIEGKLLT